MFLLKAAQHTVGSQCVLGRGSIGETRSVLSATVASEPKLADSDKTSSVRNMSWHERLREPFASCSACNN
jgi:hypothetical protein